MWDSTTNPSGTTDKRAMHRRQEPCHGERFWSPVSEWRVPGDHGPAPSVSRRQHLTVLEGPWWGERLPPCSCSFGLDLAGVPSDSAWEPNSVGGWNLQHWCLQGLRCCCVALPQQTGKLLSFLLWVEAAEEPSQVNQKNPTILQSLELDVWFSKHFLWHFPSRTTDLTSMRYLIYLPRKVRGLSLQFLCALWFSCGQILFLLRTQVDGPFGESCTRA